MKDIYEIVDECKSETWRYGPMLYSPVVYHNEILFEGKRNVSDQKIRFNLLPIDFENESILDVGSNSGYILIHLKKHHNAGHCVGIDISENMTQLADFLAKDEKLTGIDFECSDLLDLKPSSKYDNSLLLSVSSPAYVREGDWACMNFEKILNKLSEITKKYIYVEPTNNVMDKADKQFYDEYFKKWGEPEFLGLTDYQDRFLYRIKVINK